MDIKNLKKYFLFSLIIITYLWSQITLAQENIKLPKLNTPFIITTCGQNPGALNVYVLSKRINLPCEKIDLLTDEDLRVKKESGSACQTLMIVMGSSLKGLGAAGIKIEDEIYRTEKLLKEAKEQGIFVIGAHIEGMARRVDKDDEESINTVVPESNLLLVRADGNEDDHFSLLAKKYDIPLIIIENTLEITDLLTQMFDIGT